MYIYCNKIPKKFKVFLHVQTDYLWTIDLVKINIYRFHKIINLSKTLAESPLFSAFS